MKKIIAATVLALVASSVFANVVTKTITKDDLKGPQTQNNFDLTSPDDAVYIYNSSSAYQNVVISVDKQNRYNVSINSDPITVTCNDKTLAVSGGSYVICGIAQDSNAKIQVTQGQFKNGSTGSSEVIKVSQ